MPEKPSSSWTSSLFRWLARRSLASLQRLGAVAGWLTYAASPTYRRRIKANAAQAGLPLARVRGAVAHAGRMVMEMPRLWLGAPVPLQWNGESAVEAAYAAGRGVIFLTPHLGCFEITAQALAARFSPRYGPLTVLFRPARQAWMNELMVASRQRPGLETAPTTLVGVRQMIKALRAGRSVGLLPDQVPPEGQGVWSPWFGRAAYTMTLAARLAQQTGAVVVLCWGERLPRGQGFRVHFRPLDAPLAGDLQAAVDQINAALERLIREHPEQYLWGYGRYKKPRIEP